MLARLALLFVVVPILELALLIQLGQWVGFWPTIGLVVLTGVTGAALARAEGLRTLMAFQKELAGGGLPGQPLMDGLSVLVGGAFLLTPGLITDVLGFSLLIPPSRRWLQRQVRKRLESAVDTGQVHFQVWTPTGWNPGAAEPGRPTELDPDNEIRRDA